MNLLQLLFGWAAIPFVYLCSTIFKTPVTAYAIVTTVLSILGMVSHWASYSI